MVPFLIARNIWAHGRVCGVHEEWHHKAPSVDVAQPWRVMIKLRVSTLAGFDAVAQVPRRNGVDVDLGTALETGELLGAMSEAGSEVMGVDYRVSMDAATSPLMVRTAPRMASSPANKSAGSRMPQPSA